MQWVAKQDECKCVKVHTSLVNERLSTSPCTPLALTMDLCCSLPPSLSFSSNLRVEHIKQFWLRLVGMASLYRGGGKKRGSFIHRLYKYITRCFVT